MRSEGRNSADTDAHLASVYKSVREAVVDASRRFHVRICCPTASGSSSFPPSSQLSILPVEICSDLLQSAYEGSMPFRLSLSLCCVVCLLSYTAEMEQTVRPFTCADKGAGSGYEDGTDVSVRGVDEEESGQCKAEEHHRTHVLDPANVLHSADLSSRDTHTVFPVRTFKPDFFVQLDSGALVAGVVSYPLLSSLFLSSPHCMFD